ncbi:MAG: TonB-dependent receptor, partial [Lewinella sp.]|nr:TonB-dependent receptor [Lewinella sp.]
LRGYDPTNSPNPVLANYNNPFDLNAGEQINPEQLNYAFSDDASANNLTLDDLYAINGRTSSLYTNSWGFHSNVGAVYNQAQSAGQEVLIFNANASFDIVPKGSAERGRHNVQLGVAYEQRTERAYAVSNPARLWVAARQNANAHFQGIDLENADTVGMIDLPEPFFSAPLLGIALADLPDARFYRAVRESLGMNLNEYVNTDNLTPDQLSLDMFSAAELNDQFILSYYGKDYIGNDFDGTFNEFFTTRDADGIRSFPVAPNRPLYFAGYLQDKFTFRDIIFRLGVRVDRYDANTSVLRDPYSLYAIQGASEFHGLYGGERPGNIGDDFRVYTSEDDGETVQAYRDGDNWYKADGTPVNGPQEIEGIRTGLVYPKYQDPNAHVGNYIKSEDFDPRASFKDYEVQWNVMPRLAFSFPISDKANFFAHYDILVQRPPSNTLATALNYYYFVETTGSSVFNNPDLRPERTVDYEVGFMQRLTNSSAIKISAYYKEMRDMIQSRVFFPVAIVGQYETYDNLDFGTTKGFSFNYDLRRTNNVSITANYTLQFADGTGSNANSSRGLGNRGIQRTLFPLSFDERHRLNLVLDYRYPGGNAYNGPRIGGLDIFANAGLNLQAVAVSGRPYTARELATSEFSGAGTIGAINGARKPWTYTLNLRVDKNFKIGDGIGLNIYCRISNLLDRRNVLNVYSVTGSAEDDGFLRSSFGQDKVAGIEASPRSLDSYLASYQWLLLNPDFFSLPRRIFVGAIMDF